jgi:lipopolysaccharide/colanic/teichoic acid biosynthesis glycosyltransferase
MTESSASLPAPSLSGSSPWKHSAWAEDGLKRLFDIIVSALGIIGLAPLFVYIVYRIKRDSPGPIYYYGPRMGRNGKIFKIIKFRTMYERPQSYEGPRVTAQDDPRITPFGRWLRDTKINELPQLVNVLKGEMSLVGPRPEDPDIANTWEEPARSEILSVRPGITSPASVLYRDEEGMLKNSHVMDTYMDEILPSKIRLDQLYVRHRSFWGDLDILFWTALVLLPKVGSYSPPESQLFVGPLNQFFHRHVNWFLADTFITFIAMGVTGLLWRSFGPLDVGIGPAAALAVGFSILFSLVNVVLRVNRIAWRQAAAIDALDLLPGAALATGLALLTNYFYPNSLITLFYQNGIPDFITRPLLPSGLVILASGMAYMGFVIARFRTRLITGLATRWVHLRGLGETTRERILIIGSGETGRFAAWLLNQGRYAHAYRVIGFVDDDFYKQETRILGVQVIGGRADIPRLVEMYDIGIIVFAIHNIEPHERQQVLDICGSTGTQLLLFPDIPAALGNLVRAQGQTNEQHSGDNAAEYVLPCHLCLTRVSPMKVDGWLETLQTTLESGDIMQAQEQITNLRSALRSESTLQRAANLAGRNPPPEE